MFQLFLLLGLAHLINGLGYNPLPIKDYPGYKNDGWTVIYNEGALSAAASDYKAPDYLKGIKDKPDCVRVVVFMAHGDPLDKLLTDCDTPEANAGLFVHDQAIRYFDAAVLRQEAPGRYLLVRRVDDGKKCSRTTYVLGECKDEMRCPGPQVKHTEDSYDISCAVLGKSTYPPMLLLSSNAKVEHFDPVNDGWTSFNPHAGMGFATKEVRTNNKCFRSVMMTDKGHAIHEVKMTCGPLSDVNYESKSIRMGDTLYLTNTDKDKFSILLNNHNNQCIRKTVVLEVQGDSLQRRPLPDVTLAPTQEDCRLLVNGIFPATQVTTDTTNLLKTTPLQIMFPRDMLKDFVPTGELLDYNLKNEMSLLVQSYTNTKAKTNHIIVTCIAWGVPLLPVIVPEDHTGPIIFEDKAVYYGTDVAFTKLYAKNSYQIMKRIDEGHCFRKLYGVTLEPKPENNGGGWGLFGGGKSDDKTPYFGGRKDETTTKDDPKVNILDDKECKALAAGTHLHN